MLTLSVAAGLWLLTVLALTSDAGVSIIGIYYIMFGGAALLFGWIALHVARLKSETAQPAHIHSVIVPACLVIAIAASVVEGPRNPLFFARFRLSQSALTREADRIRQLPEPVRFDTQRVGLFLVQRVDVIDGQVRMITTGCGVVDSCGLVYAPKGEPK